jgi:uncharacterized metal-binding protein
LERGTLMYNCVNCKVEACNKESTNLPKNCPMKDKKIYELIRKEYEKEEINKFYIESAKIESKGYCHWTRVEETIEFCKNMKFKKIGIAFCIGLKKEAAALEKIFKFNDFEVISVVCKNGGIPKEEMGVKDEEKIKPGTFESMCNPVGQAFLLNKEKTDFNVVVGLCVGHDSLFFKYSDAPATVLVAKDRVLSHNPVGALYCAESYYSKKLYQTKNKILPNMTIKI